MSELTADSTSRTVQTERWKLHYHEAGTGPVIIMLHGSAPGSSGWSNFSGNIAHLARRFRVILLDQPGWGESDPNASIDEPRDVLNALAVRLLMDELGIGQAALVGNSMGGATTQQFAITYPDRMTHYVTMGAGRGGPLIGVPTGRPSEGLRVGMLAYRDPTPQNFRQGMEVMVYDPGFLSDEIVQSRAAAAARHPEHLKNFLDVQAAQPSYTPMSMLENLAKLATLKVPALLMHGRDDRVISCEHSIHVAAIIPNARLIIFNKCGHWVQIEREAEFNAALESFLLYAV